MNPSEEESKTLKSVGAILEWAGMVKGDEPKAYLELLGLTGSEHPRVLAVMPVEDYEALLQSYQIGQKPPNPAQLARTRLVGRTCRYLCNYNTDEQIKALQEAEAKAKAASIDRLHAQSDQKVADAKATKVKLATVIDQMRDGEVDKIGASSLQVAYNRYKEKQGDYPVEDTECTDEQLTGFEALASSGYPPYTDFAIWGPHGYRIMKRVKCNGVRIGSDGKLESISLDGPAALEMWQSCYKVFKTACIMFDTIDPSRIDEYHDLIKGYSDRYGKECWAIIYQADVRARREQLERKRRIGLDIKEAAEKAKGAFLAYDDNRPWNYAWKEMVGDVAYWRKQVEEPCLLVNAKVITPLEVLEGDAAVARNQAASVHGEHGFARFDDRQDTDLDRIIKREGRPPLTRPPPNHRNSQPTPKTEPPRKRLKHHNVDSEGQMLTNRAGSKGA